MSKTVWLALVAAGFATASSFAVGDEQTQKREQSPQQVEGLYFGSQLLTEEEQAAYRARIRSAKTPQEMEAIRTEHYELMKARAREKGIALPEKRPPSDGDVGKIFGTQGITEEERAAYRAKLRRAKTKETLEKIRTEYHGKIEALAGEKGISQPETKPARASSGERVMGTMFGEPLMTEEEQSAYRASLRGAKTQEEREKIRAEHRRQLRTRQGQGRCLAQIAALIFLEWPGWLVD